MRSLLHLLSNTSSSISNSSSTKRTHHSSKSPPSEPEFQESHGAFSLDWVNKADEPSSRFVEAVTVLVLCKLLLPSPVSFVCAF